MSPKAKKVPNSMKAAAISYVCSQVPRKELPGVGISAWSALSRDVATPALEAIRVALNIHKFRFYETLALAWYEERNETMEVDDD